MVRILVQRPQRPVLCVTKGPLLAPSSLAFRLKRACRRRKLDMTSLQRRHSLLAGTPSAPPLWPRLGHSCSEPSQQVMVVLVLETTVVLVATLRQSVPSHCRCCWFVCLVRPHGSGAHQSAERRHGVRRSEREQRVHTSDKLCVGHARGPTQRLHVCECAGGCTDGERQKGQQSREINRKASG
jgi:hypothetical protein